MIKKHWQIILIVLMAIIIYFLFQGRARDKDTIQTLVHQSDSAFNQVRYYKDKNDRLQAQVNTHEVTLRNFKDYWALDSKRLKSQIGNLNKLVGFWKGKAATSGDFKVPIVKTPTLATNEENTTMHEGIVFKPSEFERYTEGFNWTNDYLTISGTLLNDSVSISYQYQVNFQLTSYYKKTGLFKKQLVADINFSDPNLKVTEFTALVIKPKERFYQKTWFQVGLGVLGGLWLGSKF